MAKLIKPQVISAEEVLRTEIIVSQALIDLLVAKRVITEKELLEGIREIKQEQEKLLFDSPKIVSLNN